MYSEKNICKEIKTAILICGHLRTCRHTIDSLKKYLINRIPADVFVSTWDSEDIKDSTWWRNRIFSVKKTREKEIQKLYSPKATLIQKQQKIMKYPVDRFLKHPAGSLLYSTKSVLDCFKLAKNHGNYERFVVIRPDLKLFSNIREDEINDQKNNYFCRHDYFTLRGKISDVWWICGHEYFTSLKEYREKKIIQILNSEQPIAHQEDVLTEFLAERKVPLKLSKTKWGLQRSESVIMVWPQENEKLLAIPLLAKILKMIVLQIEKAHDKTVLRLGHEDYSIFGRSSAKKRRSKKKKNSYPAKLRALLPRFSAGKFYLKISFLKH